MPKSTRKITRSQASGLSQRVEPTRTSTRTRNRQQPANLATPKPNIKRPIVKRQTVDRPASELIPRSQIEVEADPNRQLRLFSLPKELLQQIAHELPLASIMCLTLTCKEAANVIGAQSWVRYKKEKQWSLDRKDFCRLVVKDWGHLLEYCACCNALHPPMQPARSHRETKLTKFCFGQDAMVDYLPKDESHGYGLVFAHVNNAMELSGAFAGKNDFGPLIEALSGDFTIAKNDLLWRLESTGRRVDGNLVVKHVHTFRSENKKSLRAADLLSLPIRLCPHQSTSTRLPERSQYIKGAEQNGPLLTHAIISAFPTAARGSVSIAAFKQPTPSEQEQMTKAQTAELSYWRCRSCLTKYCVEHLKDALVITSWHSFGRDLYHASKYWKWLVRREGKLLGTDKRNDEWWSPSRTVPDFMCEVDN